MAKQFVIAVDLVDLFEKPNRKGYLHTLAWGDYVEVLETTDTHLHVNIVAFEESKDGSILPIRTEAYITPTKSSGLKPADVVMPRKQSKVLKVNFVDVQQGDGSVIETPQGKIMLIDGGDNQLFARYLAARFRGTSPDKPKAIDCILVSHGDADHFSGLTEIYKSEENEDSKKRLFIAPQRVYHNGLVKRPGEVPDKDMLGVTVKVGNDVVITDLVDNLLDVPDEEMNLPFKKWKAALSAWNDRSPIEFRNLSYGQDDAFDFLAEEGVQVSVLGPFLTGKGKKQGLKFLGKPPKGPRVGHESLELGEEGFSGLDPGHTINGHSVVLRIQYGGFSFLFSGDLNDEASRILARKQQGGEISLRSEVFKVPHHGSADFSGAFVQMVSPVVSVVSSGDESARKEYIHPRATLMGALGKHSRVEEPLIFVTELVAFINLEGPARLVDEKKDAERGPFFAFSRTAYGIVKTRTDGNRLLVYTDSGKANMKEAYCYGLDDKNGPVPVPVIRA